MIFIQCLDFRSCSSGSYVHRSSLRKRTKKAVR